MTGEDWQDLTSNQDVWDKPGKEAGGRFFGYPDGTDITKTAQALYVPDDPTFTKVVKCFQTDARILLPGATTVSKATIYTSRNFSGIDKAWYRFLMKLESGFKI